MYKLPKEHVLIPRGRSSDLSYKVSLCTSMMNRLDDLKETYASVLAGISSYGHSEWVLVNYCSIDGMDEWVRENLQDSITNCTVSYYRVLDNLKYYHHGHSRNIAMRLGRGDILVTLDPDTYLGETFLPRLNYQLNNAPQNVIYLRDDLQISGCIAISPEHFKFLGGFDEDLTGHSSWERDIFFRSLAAGFNYVKLKGHGGRFRHEHKEEVNHPNSLSNFPPLFHSRDAYANMRLTRIAIAIKLVLGHYIANKDRHWGKARLLKNFTEEMSI
jgi:hypothetical protein